jgi:hypothetical protein
MERKTWEVEDFIEGANMLPTGYHWNVVLGTHPVVQVSLDRKSGTRSEDSRNPLAPTVHIPTDWDGLIRLAVQISHMASAAGVKLPDGVLIKVTH